MTSKTGKYKIESKKDLITNIEKLKLKPELLAEALPNWLGLLSGPKINSFTPIEGRAGTKVTITGANFSETRDENKVQIGGELAYVLASSKTELTVISSMKSTTGQLTVDVESKSALGPVDFTVLGYPVAGAGEDGPPVFFEGSEGPSQGVDPIGTIKSLIVICRAGDTLPADPDAIKTAVEAEFDQAIDYFDEVSYGRTDLELDYTDWVDLSGNYTDYVDGSINNFSNPEGLTRIVAEAAQGAVDQGLDLDDYIFMGVVMYLDGGFVRAWGGWSQSNFSYNDNGLNINITTSNAIGLTTIGDNADWGRFSHELSHSLVDAGAVLGEDIYSSDLIDPSTASASRFDLMGNHDSHPCFSGHFMRQLGYYDSSNIVELDWDRNAFQQTFQLVEHGTTENSSSSRKHLIQINVGGGVFYYVEVRKLNDSASLHFDTQIPVSGPNDGGVLVTKVFTDQVNLNHEMRFLTLLHDVSTQETGIVIDDPERALNIRVGNAVSTNPLVYEVEVAWAQVIADDVNGSFDLRLSQASKPWISDDLWVDRQAWGITPDTDGNGNIVASLEKPRPGEINRFYGQVFNSGPDDASNVKMTFYAISPPGIGDNGAWAPIGNKTIPNVPSGTALDTFVNWTPLVGEHTCLKVHASQQLGEITGSNNMAQENVFHFAPSASSPPDPVKMSVAIRNPLDEDVAIPVHITGVPRGYVVYLPHSWYYLSAKGQRIVDFLVIPHHDIEYYRERKMATSAKIEIKGYVPHSYSKSIEITDVPAFTHLPIGGVEVNVTPKYRTEIEIKKNPRKSGISITGRLTRPLGGQKITVHVHQVQGLTVHADVMTDSKGAFSLCINPSKMKNNKETAWSGRETKDIKGIFEIFAETFDSIDMAYARSNVVYYDFAKEKISVDNSDSNTGKIKRPRNRFVKELNLSLNKEDATKKKRQTKSTTPVQKKKPVPAAP